MSVGIFVGNVFMAVFDQYGAHHLDRFQNHFVNVAVAVVDGTELRVEVKGEDVHLLVESSTFQRW